MPEETKTAPAKRGGPSLPWLPAAAGLSTLAAAALLAAVLTMQYLESRPVNLRLQTADMASEISELIRAHYVPDDAVERDPAVLLQDGRSFWYLFRFRVATPETLNAEGLRTVIKKTMQDRHPELLQVYENPQSGMLSFALANRVFAEVVFTQEATPEPVKSDLRSACARIAEQAQSALIDHGLPLEGGISLEREDEQTRWMQTCVEMPPIPGVPFTYVEDLIFARLEEKGLATTLAAQSDGIMLRLLHADKDCFTLFACGGAPEWPTEGDMELEGESAGGAAPPLSKLPLESSGVDAAGDDWLTNGATVSEGPPRVAIILDDGGYGGASTEKALTLDPRLTLAILPNTPFATDTAQRAAQLGFEVILHMPMETHGKNHLFPGQIETSMTPEDIRKLTESALIQVPGIVGVNNHTGSKFTADAHAMQTFLDVIKGYGLYFVDSRTTGSSVAFREARALGIPTAARHIFLDNELNAVYIRQQVQRLIDAARKHGAAIGIGHFRRATVAVLAEILPQFEQENIVLVHASELVR